MNNLRKLIAASVVVLFGSLMMSGLAVAQNPEQLLDTITVTGADFAIELNTDGALNFDRLVPQDSNDSERDFVDCVSTATGGLTCIDRDNIRHWSSPFDPDNLDSDNLDPSTLFSCANKDLPFNTRKGNGCTAIARDAEGALYLGGRLNGTANIIIKVVEDTGDGCPEPGAGHTTTAYIKFTVGSTDFCWATIETGRPRIEDIDVIEGRLVDAFPDGKKRLLVLEAKKTVLVYKNFDVDPRDTEVVVIASGKRDFGLNPKEQIQNAMLMEYVRPDGATSEFFFVVATNHGRLISLNGDGTLSNVVPTDLTSFRDLPNSCPAGEDSFDVAQGPNGGVVYATDRNFCQLRLMNTQSDESNNFAGFSLVTSVLTSVDEDMTTKLLPPLTISAFAGFGFDLGGCTGGPVDEGGTGGCTLISGATGAAASLANVTVAQTATSTGVILFHVAGLPHCAWIPVTCVDFLGGTINPVGDRDAAVEWLLDSSNFPNSDVGALLKLDPGAAGIPAAEALVYNVTPFLPSDVTDQFTTTGDPETGGLPPLLFPPEYRAQISKKFIFDALFFVPEEGVETEGVLTLDVDVSELTGSELGCTLATDLPLEFALGDLLLWDVTVRASERFATIDADYSVADMNYQGSMVNANCINPTRSRSGGISIFPVDFELTPCPVTLVGGKFVSDADGNCVIDGINMAQITERPDDAVFAKLYVKLYDELFVHLQQWACRDPGFDMGPLSLGECATLEAVWFNGKNKLIRALEASIAPDPEDKDNCSNGSRNFGSVRSQLENYGTELATAAVSVNGPDPANRIGEQGARVETLLHLLIDKLLPSVPACPFGFVEFDTIWAE